MTASAGKIVRVHRRFIPLVALLFALMLVGVAAASLNWMIHQADREQFQALVQDLNARIERGVSQSFLILHGTLALFHVHPGPVSHAAFRAYAEQSQAGQAANGMQGVGYARRTLPGDVEEVERGLRAAYGEAMRIEPPILQGEGFPVVFIEPRDERNLTAVGFDMFSRADRRAAMEQARDTGLAVATAPVELVHETDSEPLLGFLVYLPFYGPGPIPIDVESRRERLQGFVYAAYRGDDFFRAALRFLGPSPVRVRIHDEAAGETRLLYDSQGGGDVTPLFREERAIEVAGRRWILDYSSAASFRTGLERSLLGMVVMLGLLLAAATGAIVFYQMRALDQAERDIALGQRAQAEKDLLLQEMKHRIKNSLARVSALARQTARSTPNIEEFVKTFEARIQAMSLTQDLITSSKQEEASLRTLLESELSAGLGHEQGKYTLDGPDAFIGARQALGLGLTVHELATNALKHGGLSEPEGHLKVSWRVEDGRLDLVWQESGKAVEEPTTQGFGSRLIDMSIQVELGGRIERAFTPEGFRAAISIPLANEAG